ncbi:MAG TPA: hemolysin family protein [Polyangia bacterium]|nr:hemolysin family protein [Polyangia bacterium]
MSPSLALLLTMLIVLANAFFVAAEFAFVKIRPTRLQQLVKQGSRRARLLLTITKQLPAYLSASQLGITISSLSLGWLGEPAFAKMLRPFLEQLGIWHERTVHTVAVAVSLGVITFMHTVIGELAPKALALQLTEPIAMWSALPFRAFYILAYPIIWTLKGAAFLVLRVLRLPPASEAEMLHSPEELRVVVQHVKLDPGARRLIDRVFDYTHRVARHVMTLRRDVVTLEAGRPFEDNLRVAVSNQYSRYPLVEPLTDRVVGYVHIKDIVTALASGTHPQRMRELVREPIYASEDTRLEWLRREFQRRRVHIAIILGPGHAFTGIVTLEDLVEEVLGEIQDEQDQEEIPPITRHADGSFEADGRLTLDVATRELGINFPPVPPEVETLGGFIVTQLSESAVPGDVVTAAGHRLTVLEVRDRRIRRVRGVPLPPEDVEGDENERAKGV